MKVLKQLVLFSLVTVLLLTMCLCGLAEGNPDAADSVNAGSIVKFGTYPQTQGGNDNTPIEWIVLDVQDGKALLLSRYGLDDQPYTVEELAVENYTWEKSTMRAWLNNDFLQRAFSAQEQAAIVTTTVDNSTSQAYPDWEVPSQNNTEDKVFLLSYAEANKYLGVTKEKNDNANAQAILTDYAVAIGTYNVVVDGSAMGCWYLRSPGTSKYHISVVGPYGDLIRTMLNDYDCVRPAMWVDLNALGN